MGLKAGRGGSEWWASKFADLKSGFRPALREHHVVDVAAAMSHLPDDGPSIRFSPAIEYLHSAMGLRCRQR